MILRDDGMVQGTVSGGCIEDDLIRRKLAGEFSDGPPQVVRYGVTQDEALRFGLPCGGTLELVVEPAPDHAALEILAERIAGGQLVRRELDLASGRVVIHAGAAGDALAWDGTTLSTPHGPAWRNWLAATTAIARPSARRCNRLSLPKRRAKPAASRMPTTPRFIRRGRRKDRLRAPRRPSPAAPSS